MPRKAHPRDERRTSVVAVHIYMIKEVSNDGSNLAEISEISHLWRED